MQASYSCIHYMFRFILFMSALQHIQTLSDVLKSPEVFAKPTHRRDAARTALESLFMSTKDESIWIALDKLRIDLSKIFDPTVPREETVLAHTRALRSVPDLLTRFRVKIPAAASAAVPVAFRESACVGA